MTGRVRFTALAPTILACGLVVTTPAFAWKAVTHVFLAEEAARDALADGKVTIYATDFWTGQIRRDASGQFVKLGDYAVDANMLAAIRAYPSQFRAGAIGPDAYPDIVTGQMVIHPAGANGPGQPLNVDLNPGGPGTDPWLRHLYKVSYSPLVPMALPPAVEEMFDHFNVNVYEGGATPADQTAPVRAFVVGFLAHAAGDLHGHTYINYYTGGPFHFVENAVKHTVLEGYIADHTPALPSSHISLDGGVSEFIYRQMANAIPGVPLETTLLRGDNARFSLPHVFSKIRAELRGDINAYYRRKKELAGNAAAQTIYVATHGAQVTYKERWVADIDAGLKAWPAVSHEIARGLVFSPAGMDVGRAKAAAEDYVYKHLLSMSGLPDFVGSSIGLVNEVLSRIEIPYLSDLLAEMKRDLLQYAVKRATGMTVEQLKSYAGSPEQQFDRVLNSPDFNTEGTGHLVSLADFSRNQLKLASPTNRFDYRVVPAAYNSVVMIKLMLMTPSEVNRLLVNLGSSRTLSSPNAMLGFARTLDGSNQWMVNPEQMAVTGNAYKKVFMDQPGDLYTRTAPSQEKLPAAAPRLP